MNRFSDLINRRETISASNVELLRGIAEVHIEDAIKDSDFDCEVTQRLRRLHQTLEEAERKSPDHKIALLQDTVIPFLESLEEENT